MFNTIKNYYYPFVSVIYDNDITEQFVNTLKKIMIIPPRKIAYIGMEKRYVTDVIIFSPINLI